MHKFLIRVVLPIYYERFRYDRDKPHMQGHYEAIHQDHLVALVNTLPIRPTESEAHLETGINHDRTTLRLDFVKDCDDHIKAIEFGKNIEVLAKNHLREIMVERASVQVWRIETDGYRKVG